MIIKIALVTVTQMDFGIRTVSGILRNEGLETAKVSLLKDGPYTENEISAILNLFSQFDFIAFTATDYGFGKVVQLVKAVKDSIKKPDIDRRRKGDYGSFQFALWLAQTLFVWETQRMVLLNY